jgi:2-haloacid dehalogenase
LQWFDGILVSGEENMKKPDPSIYELILERYDINKDHALFIDDSQRNVAAAEKTGIKSIHFKSPAQLKERLKNMGY